MYAEGRRFGNMSCWIASRGAAMGIMRIRDAVMVRSASLSLHDKMCQCRSYSAAQPSGKGKKDKGKQTGKVFKKSDEK